MFAKQGLRSLVTMFFVLGAMFFTATTASAQYSDHEVSLASQQNFIGSVDANAVLKQSVEQIHVQLPGLNGTTLTLARMRVQYHKSMIRAIEDGTTVKEALTFSLAEAIYEDQTKSSVVPNVAPMLNQLYIETANMLAQ